MAANVQRGEIHLIPVTLPKHDDPNPLAVEDRRKMVFVLRTPRQSGESYVPVLVASTDRRRDNRVALHEVAFDPEPGMFNEPTKIDCRWVYSVDARRFGPRSLRFQLPETAIIQILARTAEGLGLFD